jgi:ferritin
MIKTKKDLMEIVDHYKKEGDYDSAINFLENFPMKNVDMNKEIKKINDLKYKINEPKPIVEKILPKEVEQDKEDVKDDN